MNARTKAVGVGCFIVIMLVLGIGMIMVVQTGTLFGQSGKRYELVYDTSVKGLGAGAPVTLKGVKIGEVVSVTARFYKDSNTPLNSIIVDIYPNRITFDGGQNEDLGDMLMRRGLAAKLKTQSILTGLLYIEMDVYSEQPETILVNTDFPQIPTVPSDMEKLNDFSEIDFVEIVREFQDVLHNVKALTGSEDFQQLAVSMNKTLASVDVAARKMGGNADKAGKDMAGAMLSMKTTMDNMNKAVESVNNILAEDSPMLYQLDKSLKDMSHAARSMERLTDMLEQQPNSILSGRRGTN